MTLYEAMECVIRSRIAGECHLDRRERNLIAAVDGFDQQASQDAPLDAIQYVISFLKDAEKLLAAESRKKKART